MKIAFFFLLISSLTILGCSGKRTEMTECEAASTELAADKYYRLYNDDKFENVDEVQTSASKNLFSENYWVSELGELKKKYGNVTARSLRSVSVEPEEGDQCGATVVVAHYDISAERGRYVDQITWHVVDGEAKLAMRALFEYDEKGKLYLTLKLQHSINSKETTNTKIPIE